jgi:NADH:ubiquinone oxidoreductase subunit H
MDQLMDLGWKVLVPLTLIYLFIVAAAVLILQEVS